jgi:hypothetical protein
MRKYAMCFSSRATCYNFEQRPISQYKYLMYTLQLATYDKTSFLNALAHNNKECRFLLATTRIVTSTLVATKVN